jgi:hypothetical protein
VPYAADQDGSSGRYAEMLGHSDRGGAGRSCNTILAGPREIRPVGRGLLRGITARCRSASRSGSPARRRSASVISANGISSMESTSIRSRHSPIRACRSGGICPAGTPMVSAQHVGHLLAVSRSWAPADHDPLAGIGGGQPGLQPVPHAVTCARAGRPVAGQSAGRLQAQGLSLTPVHGSAIEYVMGGSTSSTGLSRRDSCAGLPGCRGGC